MKRGNSAVVLLYTFLLLCLETHLAFNEQNERCASVRNINGIHLAGFTYQSFIVDSLDKCFTKCRNSERCQSINYAYGTHQCDMNGETILSKPDAVLVGTGMTYVENLFRVKKGSKPTVPAHTCKDILNRGDSTGDGEYWIADPSDSVGNSLKVFCDMTTDGGGWMLIKNLRIHNTDTNATETVRLAESYSDIFQYNNSLIITVPLLHKLKEDMPFEQLRFYCFKKSVGRVFHVMTNRDPLGEAVVQFFTNSTIQPKACGSYTAFPDDNSTLSKNCHKWGKVGHKNSWGSPRRLGERRLFKTLIVSDSMKLKIKISPKENYVSPCCDESPNSSFPLSVGDEWKIFVR